MNPYACENVCLDPTTDMCVEYTGPDIDFLGIKKGQKYNEAFVVLANSLSAVLENNVQLKCLYDGSCGTCEPVVNVPKAVEILIDKLCNFNAKDVSYNGSLYCLGEGSTSGEAYKLIGKSFPYSVSLDPIGSSLGYNLEAALGTLPQDYAVGASSVIISGKPKRGRTIIFSSNKRITSLPIENDRYPINMKVNLDVLTPNGSVTLSKNISIPSPIVKDYTAIFDVKDFTNPDNSKVSLDKFNDMIASEVCSLTSYLNTLKSFEIAESESFNVGGPGIESAIGALAGAIQGLYNKIESIEKQMETCCQCCNNCGCGDSQ